MPFQLAGSPHNTISLLPDPFGADALTRGEDGYRTPPGAQTGPKPAKNHRSLLITDSFGCHRTDRAINWRIAAITQCLARRGVSRLILSATRSAVNVSLICPPPSCFLFKAGANIVGNKMLRTRSHSPRFDYHQMQFMSSVQQCAVHRRRGTNKLFPLGFQHQPNHPAPL